MGIGMASKSSIPRPQGATEALTANDYIAVVAPLLENRAVLDAGKKFKEKVQYEAVTQLTEQLEVPEFTKLLENLKGDVR